MKLLKESTLEDLGVEPLVPRGEWVYALGGDDAVRSGPWNFCTTLSEQQWGAEGLYAGYGENIIYARRRPRPTIELPPYEGATPNTKYGWYGDVPCGANVVALLCAEQGWLGPTAYQTSPYDIVAYEDKENN